MNVERLKVIVGGIIKKRTVVTVFLLKDVKEMTIIGCPNRNVKINVKVWLFFCSLSLSQLPPFLRDKQTNKQKKHSRMFERCENMR